MDGSIVGAVVAIAAVFALGVFARRGGKAEEPGMPRADASTGDTSGAPVDADAIDDDEDEEFESVEVVAVTSDGYALVPDKHAVRLVPPHEEGEEWKAGTTGHSRRGQRALDMSWNAGDFTGGRVVHGAADEGPWRFEALGRDGEYTAFVFETREGADAAQGLFQSRGVIRLGHDDDGNEVPPSSEQFEESRRIFLETEAALGQDDDGR
jgi:hypothetical protein